MYFICSGADLLETPKARIDLSEYLRLFKFDAHIYKDKRQEFEALLARNPTFVSDLAAALVATTFSAGYISKDSYAKQALDCCRDIIQDMGFREADINRVTKPVSSLPNGNVILVPGCQNKDMLNARVTTAAQFTQKFPQTHFSIVFSGRNPSPDGSQPVRIADESTRMVIEFERILKQINAHAELPKMHRLDGEAESSTTRTNIQEFFKGSYLPAQQCNLVVVSSTFHLIRLAKELKRYVGETTESRKLQHVILVGAEDASKRFLIDEVEHIKLMMFDIFDYLIRLDIQSRMPTTSALRLQPAGPPGASAQPDELDAASPPSANRVSFAPDTASRAGARARQNTRR